MYAAALRGLYVAGVGRNGAWKVHLQGLCPSCPRYDALSALTAARHREHHVAWDALPHAHRCRLVAQLWSILDSARVKVGRGPVPSPLEYGAKCELLRSALSG